MFSNRWPIASLGNLCRLAYGKIVKKNELGISGYPVWSGYAIVGHHSQYMFEEPQVTITCRGVGGTGNIHMTPPKSWVTNLAIVMQIKDTNRLSKSYLYWAMLASNRNELITGSAQHQITIAHLKNHCIRVPPLCEQKAIAHILSSLDDKIELNRRTNDTLESMARAIFKSWFVDFDPVRAKMEGRQPYGMDTDTAALFPDSFQDSPLGKIPQGWSWTKLNHVVGINERSLNKKTFHHANIQYVDIKSINVGVLETITPYTIKDAPSRAKRLVAHGDTIWSCVRPNRKSYFFIHQPAPNTVVSTGFAVLTPKKVPMSYLYSWVITDHFVDYLTSNADGSAYPAVRPDHFAMANILIPSNPVLDKYEQIVEPIRGNIAHNVREQRTLADIRDIMLPKLISGELCVPDAEKLLEGVV